MGKVDFYYLPGCPYCAQVERLLKQLDVTYERHEVPPDRNDRSTLRQVTGQTEVPAIVDRFHGVEGMNGRRAIVDHLRTTYDD